MSAAPTWIHLFIDVPREDWARSVTFWSTATEVAPSAAWGEDGQFRTLEPGAGDAWVHVQAIDGPPRMHVDLDSTDRDAAQEHAISLGARSEWVWDEVRVMRSPGGLFFCHTLGEGKELVRSDPDRILDQVCIDVPAPLWDSEVEFWLRLTGRDLADGGRREFAFLGDEGRMRVLLQRLDEDEGPVRAHADFATADRAVEARRHEALGARTVEVCEWWTVMRAPDGRLYCLTDRDPLTGRGRRRDGH